MPPFTTDACAHLKDVDNNVVLLSSPTFEIVGITTGLEETDCCGFRKKHTATLFDGADTLDVVLPADYKVHSSGPFDGTELSEGDIITVQRMLRLYDKVAQACVILVHDVDIIHPDSQTPELQMTQLETALEGVELEKTELERTQGAKILKLESELAYMQEVRDAMDEAGFGPEYVAKMIRGLNDIATQVDAGGDVE